MAVFHLKVSVGSRAGGQSAVAKADYIEREGRYEQDREELEHKEHGNMPEWAEEDPRSEGTRTPTGRRRTSTNGPTAPYSVRSRSRCLRS